MGHIESDNPNSPYMLGSCYTQPGWSYPSHVKIERIVVVEIHITIYKRENKQTNKERKRKK